MIDIGCVERYNEKERKFCYKLYEMRTHMGAKDAKAKEFLSNNERFADLFNYYLFEGRQIIQPSDLCERDTTKVLSIFGTVTLLAVPSTTSLLTFGVATGLIVVCACILEILLIGSIPITFTSV